MERVKFTNYLGTDIYVNEMGKFSFILMNEEETEPLTYEVPTLEKAKNIIRDNKPTIIEIKGDKHKMVLEDKDGYRGCEYCSLQGFCFERDTQLCKVMSDEHCYFIKI